jgi:hypothetical protein
LCWPTCSQCTFHCLPVTWSSNWNPHLPTCHHPDDELLSLHSLWWLHWILRSLKFHPT